MRIKSYFGKTVDEGIAQARAELGSEALLLNTRKVVGQAGVPGGYEVVFGSTEEPMTPEVREFRPTPIEAITQKDAVIAKEAVTQKEAVAHKPAAPKENLASELDHLREQMDEIRNLLVRSSSARIAIGRSVPELADVHAQLMASEVEPSLAKDIVDRLEAAMSTDAFFFKPTESRQPLANRWKSLKFDAKRLEAFIRAEMRSRIRTDAEVSGNVIAVVGPTGAGKTTSLMKIAASEAAKRPVRILTLDTSRAASLIQLQSYATKIGAGFLAVQKADTLAAIVAEARKKELVMIDTPGFAGNGGQEAEPAAAAFAACGAIEVHLVAPGYMKPTDLRRSIQRYAPFGPTKLLATKLDETQALGSIFSEAVRAGLALSFLTHGPSVPGDIRAASVEDLVGMALASETARAECA
jgi:flagellar biosynthesis protein FlhF